MASRSIPSPNCGAGTVTAEFKRLTRAAEDFRAMSEPKYRIDDEGNLVEEGGDGDRPGAQNGSGPAGDTAPVSAEGARATMRALVLSEVLGVLILLGGAVYYEDYRGLLLVVAGVYAVFAFIAARYLKRSLYERVGDDPPA